MNTKMLMVLLIALLFLPFQAYAFGGGGPQKDKTPPLSVVGEVTRLENSRCVRNYDCALRIALESTALKERRCRLVDIHRTLAFVARDGAVRNCKPRRATHVETRSSKVDACTIGLASGNSEPVQACVGSADHHVEHRKVTGQAAVEDRLVDTQHPFSEGSFRPREPAVHVDASPHRDTVTTP